MAHHPCVLGLSELMTAPTLTSQAQVLKVVHAIPIHHIHRHARRATVVLAQLTLQRNVVILGAPTHEASLGE